MGYRVTNTLTTTSGNTYADTDAWIAEHGPCGTQNGTHITYGSLTRIDDSSVRRVMEYADEAAHTAHKAAKTGAGNFEFDVSATTKETF